MGWFKINLKIEDLERQDYIVLKNALIYFAFSKSVDEDTNSRAKVLLDKIDLYRIRTE